LQGQHGIADDKGQEVEQHECEDVLFPRLRTGVQAGFEPAQPGGRLVTAIENPGHVKADGDGQGKRDGKHQDRQGPHHESAFRLGTFNRSRAGFLERVLLSLPCRLEPLGPQEGNQQVDEQQDRDDGGQVEHCKSFQTRSQASMKANIRPIPARPSRNSPGIQRARLNGSMVVSGIVSPRQRGYRKAARTTSAGSAYLIDLAGYMPVEGDFVKHQQARYLSAEPVVCGGGEAMQVANVALHNARKAGFVQQSKRHAFVGLPSRPPGAQNAQGQEEPACSRKVNSL